MRRRTGVLMALLLTLLACVTGPGGVPPVTAPAYTGELVNIGTAENPTAALQTNAGVYYLQDPQDLLHETPWGAVVSVTGELRDSPRWPGTVATLVVRAVHTEEEARPTEPFWKKRRPPPREGE